MSGPGGAARLLVVFIRGKDALLQTALLPDSSVVSLRECER